MLAVVDTWGSRPRSEQHMRFNLQCFGSLSHSVLFFASAQKATTKKIVAHSSTARSKAFLTNFPRAILKLTTEPKTYYLLPAMPRCTLRSAPIFAATVCKNSSGLCLSQETHRSTPPPSSYPPRVPPACLPACLPAACLLPACCLSTMYFCGPEQKLADVHVGVAVLTDANHSGRPSHAPGMRI